MRKRRRTHEALLVLALVALLAGTSASAAGAPAGERTLEPGSRLGGVALGATPAAVRAAWGERFGRCRSCARATWYFNARPYEPEGVGVEFRGGRAAALFTLWSPAGWRTSRGVALGEHVARVTEVHGALARVECGGYYALTLPRGDTVTSFYVVGDELWGFGLGRRGVPVCR